MTFTSYSQNFEDVMLHRALKDIVTGTYVDVGAQDPTTHSVTRLFYDLGWSGVNLEPNLQFYKLLEEERPRDQNLQLGAGSSQETHTLYEFKNTGLSTLQKDIAERHVIDKNLNYTSSVIEVQTLNQILNPLNLGEIHFLKIDVEGFEKEVLLGLDLSKTRPWIIVIEATQPSTTIINSHEWQDLVTAAKYQEVYFDGLNKFFVADEHSSISEAFLIPPNCFDGFETHHQVSLKKQVHWLEQQLEQGNSQTEAARIVEEKLKVHLQELELQSIKYENQRTRFQNRIHRLNKSRKILAEQVSDLERQIDWHQNENQRLLNEHQNESQRLINEREMEQATNRIAQKEAAESARASLAQINEKANQFEIQIVALKASSSWMITSPLRYATRLISNLLKLPTKILRTMSQFFTRLVLAILRRVVRLLRRTSIGGRLADAFLSTTPKLDSILFPPTHPIDINPHKSKPLGTEFGENEQDAKLNWEKDNLNLLPPISRRIHKSFSDYEEN